MTGGALSKRKIAHKYFCETYFLTNIFFFYTQYIEDIQMFLLNMAFISWSEVENIYIS